MNSMWRRRFGSVMYRAAVTLRGEQSVFSRVDHLSRLEQQSFGRVAAVQRGLLADILRHTFSTVPYYRKWSPLVANLGNHNAGEILRELPVLDKTTLQEHPGELMSLNWTGRWSAKTTGGSTGRPVTVRKNPEAVAQEMAATWHGYGWFGVRPGDPSVRFWGQPSKNLKRRLRYIAADIAVNRRSVSAFGYRFDDLDDYIQRIERFRPVYIYGYVSGLADLARYMGTKGRQFRGDFLKHVITTSEVLTEPERALMEDVFGVSVQNEYGCGEMGPVAYECPEGSLHLLPTNQYVEILSEDRSPTVHGAPGEIVLTDLTNRVMPLIRYRIGDIGRFGESCSCGRSLPVLADIFGREYDFVVLEDGRRFHGEFFMYLFEDLRQGRPEIGQFQVIQTGARSLIVNVVLANQARSDTELAIQAEFRRRLPALQANVHRVTFIPRRPSGKSRIVENRYMERSPPL